MDDEAKTDAPAPRYEQVPGASYVTLVTDETEWLARPAGWGIGKLPHEVRERKSNLFDYHKYIKISQFVPCDVCRRAFAEMISEEGIILSGDVSDLRQRYRDRHPTEVPRCAGWPVWRASINYARGIICPTEARNATWNALFDIAHASAPFVQFTAEWKAWERAIALELIGPNPFRSSAFSTEWRTDTAQSLARTMYESREFGAMPVLADALQDAGCDNTDVLLHCRDTQLAHVRGCWVVDLVRGKQ